MEPSAKILRLVVASTGVQAEKEIVRGVVDELNRGIAKEQNLVVEVARWRKDAYAETGEPQSLVDSTLEVEDCDIFIGLLSKRFGTPGTDVSSSEGEFERACEAHRARARPLLFYFVEQTLTSKPDEAPDRWSRARESAVKFSNEVLWVPYSGVSDLNRLLREHLTKVIRQKFWLEKAEPTTVVSKVGREVHLLPPIPQLFVGRQEELRELKRRLGIASMGARQTGAPQAVTVVRGWPGVGKSTLVAALAHDPATRTAFPDGVLWTSLGEAPSLLPALAVWGRLLGDDETLKRATLSEITSELAELLANKRMLLIVDDVWQAQHTVPFEQVRGSQCALVVTTREPQIADAIAPSGAAIYNLPVLTEDSAIELLRHLAPSVVEGYPQDSRNLVHDLECLPLALQVAGHMLNAESKKGWGIGDLIVELRSGTKLLLEKAPVTSADLSTGTTPTVAAILSESTDHLDDFTRGCFAMLGVFAPKPATFDLAALQAMWQVEDAKTTARELVDHGLLEAVGGRFQVHALLIAHARSLLAD